MDEKIIYKYTVRLSNDSGDKFIFDTDKYDVCTCPTESGVIATNKKSGEKTLIPWSSIKYLTKKPIAGRYPWPEDEADKQRDIDPITKAMMHLTEDHGE